MTTKPVEEQKRLTSVEVLISPVEERDLLSIGEGYYASFSPAFHDSMEPPEKCGDVPVSVREARFAKRMEPWLQSPDGKWMKATLKDDPEQKVIGHAGWLVPREGRHVFHHWRSDAPEVLGWKKQMGWSDADVEEMWSHVDIGHWDETFTAIDGVREKLMEGKPHWFLAPLWVLPEYQGRGVSTLLLKEVLDLADATDPPTPVYLEAMPEARKVYGHFNFEAVEGHDMQMIRWAPRKASKIVD